MTDSFTRIIEDAIRAGDYRTLYDIKQVLDEVHSTGADSEYNGKKITMDDLPSDEIYEALVRVLSIPSSSIASKPSYLPELWMGSLPKPPTIKKINKPMFMPKFDGASVGIRFEVNADNELVLAQAITRNARANIRDKMVELLTPSFTSKLEKLKHTFSTISIRGEIILKDRKLTNSPPAPYVSGKINAKMPVFMDSISTLDFVPYEIMKSLKDGVLKRYTQEEAIDFFNSIGLLKFNVYSFNISDDEDKNTKRMNTLYTKYLSELDYPLDGLAYCSKDWQYPLSQAETNPSVYGKYAWKPSAEAHSTVIGFEYSMSRSGMLELMCVYNEVAIEQKKYTRAKMSFSQLATLPNIGIGAKVVVKLANGISPYILEVLTESKHPYEIPTKCPFCDSALSHTKVIKCTNINCPEKLIIKYENFLKVIGIKGIADKKLRSLTPTVSFDAITQRYISAIEFHTIVSKSSTLTFLQACGYGGKTTITKHYEKQIDLNKTVSTNINTIIEILEKSIHTTNDPSANDIFINDCYELIKSL